MLNLYKNLFQWSDLFGFEQIVIPVSFYTFQKNIKIGPSFEKFHANGCTYIYILTYFFT